jgi:hypothetical protein
MECNRENLLGLFDLGVNGAACADRGDMRVGWRPLACGWSGVNDGDSALNRRFAADSEEVMVLPLGVESWLKIQPSFSYRQKP